MSEMTPAELDRWLAEHVMGWRLDELTWFDADGGGHYDAEHVDAYDCGTCCVWHPTANIAQAIEAAEKARADGRIRRWRLYSDHLGGADVDANGACHESWRMGLAHALCHALHAALA